MICVCCGNAMNPYFTKKSFLIRRCLRCRLLAVENVPADLSPYYAAGYFTGDVTLDGYMDYDQEKEVSKRTYLNFLRAIERRLFPGVHPGATMLEVGCATGHFMNLAAGRGWQVAGIDISDYAVSQARAKGLTASVDTLDTYTTEQTFDAIVMQDVIEHVKDPAATIVKVRNLLREEGIFALTTPDAGSWWARAWGKRWHAFVPPQHLFYFSARNLTALLEKNGFTVVSRAYHGKWFTIPYIFRLLYSWTELKLFSKLAAWTAQTFLKNVAIPINVRDTLFLIARKVSVLEK